MSEKLLFNYVLTKLAVANPDGTHPATVTGCTALAQMGSTAYGPISGALKFGPSSAIYAPFPVAGINAKGLTVRVTFRVSGPVTARQNLVESTALPFSIHLLPGVAPGAFQVAVTVRNAKNGWSGPTTLARVAFVANQWFAVDLAYDVDTLGLFVDRKLVALSAFPEGEMQSFGTGELVIGVHPDKTRWHFLGDMAQVQVFAGLPADVESELDLARGWAEWFIRFKENALGGPQRLGAREGDLEYQSLTDMTVQRFRGAMIAYGEGFPSAFHCYGDIYTRYVRGNLAGVLGPLAGDESDARRQGSRRSVFARGAIYWSPETGAMEVLGRLYLDYELLGGSVSVLGLPTHFPDTIGGGKAQIFQGGRLYHRTGASAAFEVHGDILAKYLATGGPGAWGFPTSHEEDVLNTGGNPVGRQGQFEHCTILWSPQTGAHIIYGAIREAYRAQGGAAQPVAQAGLGFPTSDEADMPGVGGFSRFNTFERGAILFRDGTAIVVSPFKFYLGYLATREDEGWSQGQNDLYLFVEVWRNGTRLYSQRFPNSGRWDGDNTRDLQIHVPVEIVPNDPALSVELKVIVWDFDNGFGGGDDHIGTYSKFLDITNGWGWTEKPDGIFSGSSAGGINTLDWSLQPIVPPGTPVDFWGVANQGTPTLTYQQYDEAFSDIDDDPEWNDPNDWAQEDFFNKSIQTAANGGNCFGMCIEALHAWFARSLFSIPLARFTNWGAVRNNFNIKQIYWYGSESLWFTDEQIKDAAITPAQVFTQSRASAASGNPAIIYFFTNSDYTGTGHAVLATAWDDSSLPWRITVFDPNRMNAAQTVTINPNQQSFSFPPYGGMAGAGSIGYLPFSCVNHRQASAVWDPMLLFLGGVVVGLAPSAATESITDSAGGNLWFNRNYTGERRTYRGQFRSVAALDGNLQGEILVRRVRPTPYLFFPHRILSMPIKELLATVIQPPQPPQPPKEPHPERSAKSPERSNQQIAAQRLEQVALNPQPLPPRLARLLISSELPEEILSKSVQQLAVIQAEEAAQNCGASRPLTATERVVAILIDALRSQSTATGADFVHTIKARGRGKFQYLLKHKLAETLLTSTIDRGERHIISCMGLGSSQPITQVKTQREKTIEVNHLVRLGRSADFVRLKISRLPVNGARSLELSIRPGLSAVDILAGGEPLEVDMTVESQIDGVVSTRKFAVALDGGLRVLPRTVLLNGVLKAGRIKSLFGEISAPVLVAPM